MADSSFGLKIGLEGEREFKRAISDINREMRVLGSELKLAATSFDGTDKSAAALTARSAGLVREIDALADAVIRGDYGNGEECKRRLGANYAAVQKRVNQKLGY